MQMSLEMSLWTSYSRDTVFSPPTPCHVLPTQSRGTLRWTQRPRGQLNVIVSKYSPANKEIRLERGGQEEKGRVPPWLPKGANRVGGDTAWECGRGAGTRPAF